MNTTTWMAILYKGVDDMRVRRRFPQYKPPWERGEKGREEERERVREGASERVRESMRVRRLFGCSQGEITREQ